MPFPSITAYLPGVFNTSPPVKTLGEQLQEAILRRDKSLVLQKIKTLPGSIVNTPLPNGELPLPLAIRHYSKTLMRGLFENPELNLEQRDDQGLTALDHIFLTKDKNIQTYALSHYLKIKVEIAKKNSADVGLLELSQFHEELCNALTTPQCTTPLHNAADIGDIDAIRRFLQDPKCNVNDTTPTGESALFFAARAGQTEAVKVLLAARAKADLSNHNHVSAMHAAASSGNVEILKMLLDAGVNVNAPDKIGATPLHYSVPFGHPHFSAFRFLIKRGANPVGNTHKISPLSFIIEKAKIKCSQNNPLSLEFFETVMCVSAIASWIESYGFISDGWLSYGSSIVNWIGSYSQNIYNAKALMQSRMLIGKSTETTQLVNLIPFVLLTVEFYKTIPVLSELALLFRAYCVGTVVHRGLSKAWRNRNIDPVGSLKKTVVSFINAAFALQSISNRVTSIWKGPQIDALLHRNDCSGAYLEAFKMKDQRYKDLTLLNIKEKCYFESRVPE